MNFLSRGKLLDLKDMYSIMFYIEGDGIMDNKQKNTRILAKLGLLWEANPSLSFCELLLEISGKHPMPCVMQSFMEGKMSTVELHYIPADISLITDIELEDMIEKFLV